MLLSFKITICFWFLPFIENNKLKLMCKLGGTHRDFYLNLEVNMPLSKINFLLLFGHSSNANIIKVFLFLIIGEWLFFFSDCINFSFEKSKKFPTDLITETHILGDISPRVTFLKISTVQIRYARIIKHKYNWPLRYP